MKTRLFESFVEMIDGVPPKAILKAAELERGMIEDDLRNKRISPNEEPVRSILNFCEFIKAIAKENSFPAVELPVEQIAFYRRTLLRLIEAGEVSLAAKEQFDRFFWPDYLKAVA